MQSAFLFSQHKVNPSIISLNRVLLLHGPPGTGKTSLCKALAQKLSILYYSSYSHIALIEINSHSLFSKWFSESGKLVMKLFDYIHELLLDPSTMLFILIGVFVCCCVDGCRRGRVSLDFKKSVSFGIRAFRWHARSECAFDSGSPLACFAHSVD